MTTTQFLLLIGTIYIAPHIPQRVALYFGAFIMVVAILLNLKGLV
jgi:hypothetical protein